MNYAWDHPGPTWSRTFAVALDQVNAQEVEIVEFADAPKLVKYKTQLGEDKTAIVCTYTKKGINTLLIADSTSAARQKYGLEKEENAEQEHLRLSCVVNLANGIGVSLVESHPKSGETPFDFVWLTIRGIGLSYSDTNLYRKVYASIADIQIDDQRLSTTYPVMLYKTAALIDASKAMFQVTYIERIGQLGFGCGQSYCEYFSFLIQPVSFTADGSLLFALMHYSKNMKNMLSSMLDRLKYSDTPKPKAKQRFGLVELHPICVTITFKLSGLDEADSDSFVPDNFIARTIGLTVINVSEVPLEIKSLHLPNITITQDELIDKVLDNYRTQIASSFTSKFGLQLVASLDVLGDPLHTLQDLGAGISSFFYEPARALVLNPSDFGGGIARGTSALVGGVASGVTGAGSKMTGVLGKGMAALSMDEVYQQDREKASQRAKRSAASGVTEGLAHFGRSLFDATTGLVAQPIAQGRDGGFGGLMKGVGMGLVGLIAKPVSGAADLIGFTLRGIAGEFELHGAEAQRHRTPRFVDPITCVTPIYNLHKADGAMFAFKKIPSQFKDDVYVNHVALRVNEPQLLLICLLRRLVLVKLGKDCIEIIQDVSVANIATRDNVPQGIELRMLDSSTRILPVEGQPHRDQANAVLGEFLNLTHEEHHRKVLNSLYHLSYKSDDGRAGDCVDQPVPL